jgi:hypothetical protein
MAAKAHEIGAKVVDLNVEDLAVELGKYSEFLNIHKDVA